MRRVWVLLLLLSCPFPLFAADADISERAILDAFMKGNDAGFTAGVASYIAGHPDRPATHFYLRDLYNTARISGYTDAIEVLSSLEKKLADGKELSSRMLRFRALSFLDELEFTARKGNGTRFADAYKPVLKWNLSAPLRRYGKGDLVHVWPPELNPVKFHNADSKSVTVRQRSGMVFPSRFLYPGKGIVYASSLVSSAGGVIVRIESNVEYQFFVDGRKVLDNRTGEVYRNMRSVSINGQNSALLMIKAELTDDSYFRVTLTDSALNPVVPSYEKTAAETRGSINEIDDAPYDQLAAEYEKKKSASAALHLAWFFSEYDDRRALTWYETSLNLQDDPAVRAIYAAECGRFGSLCGCPSLEGREREESARLARKFPSCVPARNTALRDSFRYEDRVSVTQTIISLIRSGGLDYDGFNSVCGYLSENGETALLAEAAASFTAKFPRCDKGLRYLAQSRETKNPASALELYRRYLSAHRDEDTAVKAARLAVKIGKTAEESPLSEYIDDATAPAAYTAAAVLAGSGRYDAAKKLLLRMAAVKDDPEIMELFGRIRILGGGTADMFWEKAAKLEPSSRFPKDYLTYKESGKAAPLLDEYREREKVAAIISDYLAGKKYDSPVLLRSHVQKINADRSGRYFSEEIIYMRGKEDADRYGEYLIPFDRNLFIGECSVIRRDGSVSSSYAIHDVDGEKYLTVSGLAQDLLLHVTYEVDNYSPVLRGSALVCSGSIFMNGWEEAVEDCTAVIAAPSGLNLSVSASEGASVTSKETAGETVWTVGVRGLPSLKHEPRGPVPERLLGWYSFSECTAVDEFAEWYRGLWPEKGVVTFPQLRAGSDVSTVRAVYAHLSRVISHDERALFSPEKPSEVIFEGNGSAEDKVFCAREMLSGYGIRSFPALVMKKGTPAGTITTDRFSGILLYVPCEERDLWLDFSRPYGEAGILSRDAENANVIVIGANGVEQKIARSAVRTGEKYEGSIEIGASGEASFVLRGFFSGRGSNIEKYAEDDHARDELTGVLAGIFHRNAVVAESSFPSGSSGEASLQIKGTVPGFALSGTKTVSFKPFFHPTELPHLLGGESRLTPLLVNEEIMTDEMFEVLLPEGYASDMKSFCRTLTFGRGSVRYTVTGTKDSRRLVIERSVRFPECEIEPESYGDFLKFCSELREVEQIRLTFSSGK